MKKILVAEDDQFLANAYRVKLIKEGFDLRIATDGEEALKILTTFTPDLIILDLIMPIKDGFATLAEIRNNPHWKTIPILVASNLGQKGDIDKAMKLGATNFIVKSSLSMQVLVDTINAMIAPKP